jgi:hypothetical protein
MTTTHLRALGAVRIAALGAAAIALVAGSTLGMTDTAHAASTKYANCTAVHQKYSGGIAKTSVTKNRVVSGGKTTYRALKGTVKKDNALYQANKGLDRDGDGIACELS